MLNLATAKKIALVIGNSNYNQGYLPNPTKDADLIAKNLEDVGFTVTVKKDLSTAYQMEKAIDDFAGIVKDDDIAVIYYAGHGVQCKGKNYLIPTKATINRGTQLPSKALNLDVVIGAVSDIKLAIIMLDACRNNTYPSCSKSQTRGLVQPTVNSKGGMIISFATAENEVADDGSGNHSPYALALSKLMKKKMPIETFFTQVGREVFSSNGQRPMYKNSFYGKFSFGSSGGHDMRGITKVGNLMYQNQPFSAQDKSNYDNKKNGGRVWDWKGAKKYCRDLRLGGFDDWRLPNREELQAVANIELYHSYGNYKTYAEWKAQHKEKRDKHFHANKDKRNSSSKGHKYFVKKAFIENMPPLTGKYKSASFWSSTERDSSVAWGVDFYYGRDGWDFKSRYTYALCVR